jgi:REP element-mobilizing transposase RayT
MHQDNVLATNKPPGQKSLRSGRFSQAHHIYSVTTITLNRTPYFADWHVGRGVVQQMQTLHAENVIESLAFVIMPDHLHWLFVLGEQYDLSNTMRLLKARTAQKLGHRVWQSGFHDRALRSEDDLPGIARYIVANPLRAGLVKRIGDYPLWDAVWL